MCLSNFLLFFALLFFLGEGEGLLDNGLAKIFWLLWLYWLHRLHWWLKIDIKSKRFFGFLGLGQHILGLSEGVLKHFSNRIEILRHITSFWKLLSCVGLLHLIYSLRASLNRHCLLWLFFALILGYTAAVGIGIISRCLGLR